MKTTKEKRERERLEKEKLSIRVIGKTPEKKKKWPTGEFELFKKIAKERVMPDIEIQWCWDWVLAKHIFPNGEIGQKPIHIDQLTVTNFSHQIWKGRDKTKRLDPDNILIVSRAYHHWEHTRQVEQETFLN